VCVFLPQAVRTAHVLECCVKGRILCDLGVWGWCVYHSNSFITMKTAARGDGSWSLVFSTNLREICSFRRRLFRIFSFIQPSARSHSFKMVNGLHLYCAFKDPMATKALYILPHIQPCKAPSSLSGAAGVRCLAHGDWTGCFSGVNSFRGIASNWNAQTYIKQPGGKK